MVDYTKIIYPWSNYVVTNDLGWPLKVISYILQLSIAKIYKYTAFAALLTIR